ERAVDPRRVVADVEPEGREPERFHFAAYRADEEIGGALPPRCDEPVLERAQVGDQLVCRPIRRRLGRGLAPFGAGERGVELAQHARHELPIHLAPIALLDPLGVAGRRQLPGERLAELGCDRRGALGDAQGAQQIGEPLAVASQAGDAVLEQGTTRDVVRDEGVAVRAAAETTWANVPRSWSYPRATSLWRRCRMAAFCSAIDNNWNHMPCA